MEIVKNMNWILRICGVITVSWVITAVSYLMLSSIEFIFFIQIAAMIIGIVVGVLATTKPLVSAASRGAALCMPLGLSIAYLAWPNGDFLDVYAMVYTNISIAMNTWSETSVIVWRGVALASVGLIFSYQYENTAGKFVGWIKGKPSTDPT